MPLLQDPSRVVQRIVDQVHRADLDRLARVSRPSATSAQILRVVPGVIEQGWILGSQ